MSGSVYDVLALRYATHMRGAAENFLDRNDLPDLHDAGMPLDYFVWVIRNAARTIVVDTGFTPETAAVRRREILVPVPAALQAAGVAVDDVEDVIITHLHFDHAGGLGAFPKARFHIQDAEVAYATGRHMCHPRLRSAQEVEDVVTLIRRLYQGRVHFVDGDSEIFPGISVHSVPGHTPGLQCVRVQTERGAVVLASDASHLYANRELRNPYPILTSLPDMMESWTKLGALADSPEHIVPGHDPEVLRRYPSAIIPGVASALLHRPPRNPLSN
jgi:glyoxylase-like metal-dependent hydrolase (beta-lactamase superfamily II)